MLTPQFKLAIRGELVVDLFAGGGGASTGIEQAIGRAVDIAINHDPEAVALHQANHPQTRHFVSDVFEVDPLVVTDGQPVGLLWASPDCKHFSKAKGGKPVSKKIRSLAGVVLKWVKALEPSGRKPKVICLENVEEFQTWGPLVKRKVVTTDADGNTTETWGEWPCPKRKGQTFKRWVDSLRNMGYLVEWRELRACDYGAPTIRKRLFLVARCDGQPIVWPEPTHAAPNSLQLKAKKLKPWRTAAECIDWSIPAPSIFERSKPLADATCKRIAKGIQRYVVEAAEPFIVGQGGPIYSGKPATVSKPFGTITTESHRALVVPTLIQTGYGERPGQAPRVPGLEKPIGTLVGTEKHAQVQAFLIKYYGTDQDPRMTEPMHTVPTKDRFGLVTIHGEEYAIVDIGLRMLTPRELYRAQGFPEDYQIDTGGDGRPLTKTAQVRMCGNSVCPPMSSAIVGANYTEPQQQRRAA